MKNEDISIVKKGKKSYQKPVLIRYEHLTAVIAGGGGSIGGLGCTRF